MDSNYNVKLNQKQKRHVNKLLYELRLNAAKGRGKHKLTVLDLIIANL
jgi:hypothetical protein